MDDKLKSLGLEKEDLNFKCPRDVLTSIAGEFIGQWNLVGRALGVSDPALRSIPLNCTITSPEEEVTAMFDAWDQQKGREATCLKLAEVLYGRTMTATLELFCEKVKPEVAKRRAVPQPQPQANAGIAAQRPPASGE